MSDRPCAEQAAEPRRGPTALLPARSALVLLGAVLRAVGVGTSLWVDEVDTLVHRVREPFAQLFTTYSSENHHPLFSLLARLSILAFGEHEWSLRLPALLFGLASIVAAFRLASRLLGPRCGLLAALLLAVSPHHVWFSQDARGYTLLLFLALLATSEFVELLARPTRGAAFRYALFAGLATYTHLTALVVLASHALVALLPAAALHERPRPPGRIPVAPAFAALAGALALAFALYLPMGRELLQTLQSRASQSSPAVARIEPWTSPAWAALQVVRSFGGGALGAATLGLAALLAAAGAISTWRRSRVLVLLHVAALPLALLMLLLMRRHLYPRLFFFEAGFAAIVLAQGALAIGESLDARLRGASPCRAARLGTMVALLLAAGFSLSLREVYAAPKQDFVGARDYVESQRGTADAVAAVGAAKLALPGYTRADLWSAVDSAAELARLRANSPRVWVVWCLPDQLRAARPDVADALARDFVIAKEFPGSLGGGTVYVAASR